MITTAHLAKVFEQRVSVFRAGLASHDVDWHLHGTSADVVLEVCARFLFDLAEASDDSSLLPAANAALRAVADFRADQEEILRAQDDANDRYHSYAEQARAFCIVCIYKSKSPRFHIDLAHHRRSVAAARVAGGDTRILDGLDRYLSDQTARRKVYDAVLGHFRYRGDAADAPSLPTLTEVEQAFDASVSDLYRRADSYVPQRIELAIQSSSKAEGDL
jgi:hypothetical protein